MVTSAWGAPGAFYNTVSVNVHNTGTGVPSKPYTITVASPKYQSLSQVGLGEIVGS